MSSSVDHSPDKTYFYFKAPALELAFATMFGVILKKPMGIPYYYLDQHKKQVYKTLGSISVRPGSGSIFVFPLRGLTEQEKEFLVGSAEWAFRNPPKRGQGWRFCRRKAGNYWTTFISAPVDPEEDAVAQAAMSQVDFDAEQLKHINKQITEVAS